MIYGAVYISAMGRFPVKSLSMPRPSARCGATSFVKSEPELCRVRCVLGLRAIKSLESGPDRRSSRFLGIVDIKFSRVLGEMQFSCCFVRCFLVAICYRVDAIFLILSDCVV